MILKKLIGVTAASLMALGSTAAQANPASALSLSNSPAVSHARASMANKHTNNLDGGLSPFLVVGAVVAVLVGLELTGVTNIVHSKSA